MKNLKKAASLILAVMMIMSLAVPAFAATAQGTITITNVTLSEGDNGTFTAAKVFDIVDREGTVAYKINSNSPWYNFVIMDVNGTKQSKIDGIRLVETNGDEYTLTANVLVPGQQPQTGVIYLNETDFVEKATAYYNANKTAIQAEAEALTRDANGNPSATVDYGYYYVNTEMGAFVNVNSTNASVRDKGQNDMPFEKEANPETANIGDKVGYTITSKVPDTSNYTNFTYVVTDTLDEGLTLNEDTITVSLLGVGEDSEAVVLTEGSGYTVTESGDHNFTLTFDMKALTANKEYVGLPLVITYNATLNSAAGASSIQWNNASLTYTNKGTTTTVTDKDYVYTCELVIDKTDGGSNKLAGAQFVLKNAAGKYYHYENGVVSWRDNYTEEDIVTTDANGAANFVGLAAATYSLEEIAAPDGYNKLNGDVTVIINGLTEAEILASVSQNTDLSNRLVNTEEVANYSGNLLPETGGIGTTIFYIAGGVLVIGASVLLITRRRMAK